MTEVEFKPKFVSDPDSKLDKFLSIVVKKSKDFDKIDTSPYQYKPGEDGYYIMTILGFINGIIPRLPGNYVLVKIYDEVDLIKGAGKLVKLTFKKKWW